MSSLPTLAACSTCGAHWPVLILDNAGRCPQCGLDHDASNRRETEIRAHRARRVARGLNPNWAEND